MTTRLPQIALAGSVLAVATLLAPLATHAGRDGRASAADSAPRPTEAAASDVPTGVSSIAIAYRSHTGSTRSAVVLLPASYPRLGGRPLALVISPHGRGLDGATNAKLWGNLPALGFFAVVNPDGQGERIGNLSWGAPGQIADLARMPQIVRRALPWLRIDMHRIYAVGGSMGGQETLLLAARYPSLLAGALAVDPVVDLAHQYAQYPRLRCLDACRTAFGDLGRHLQGRARVEVGGTPATAPAAYAARSPLTYAPVLAHLRIPVEIWWSVKDRIVVDSNRAQSGRLVRTLRRLDPATTVVGVRGAWIHTAPLKASRQLPTGLAALGLMRCDQAHRPELLRVVAGHRPACWLAGETAL